MIWTENTQSLEAEFKFKDFSSAFAFMTEVAIASEKMNHHPSWHNVYNVVNIQLSTHDAGNIITEKDRALAQIIKGIAEKYGM